MYFNEIEDFVTDLLPGVNPAFEPFNTVEDLAVYMYAHHSAHPDYQQVLEATWEIYPELQTAYMPAIQNASRLVVQ